MQGEAERALRFRPRSSLKARFSSRGQQRLFQRLAFAPAITDPSAAQQGVGRTLAQGTEVRGQHIFFATRADLAPGIEDAESRWTLECNLYEMRSDQSFSYFGPISQRRPARRERRKHSNQLELTRSAMARLESRRSSA